ncbi:hypothetical protein TNIN_443421 [Trichonephila inaurata madagascariensis]|uniref:Endonuclease/exonuclease/phosphatase domain-containing protein n=1 Tax=Trichonephila inaurata madagascariensis TaxID=2747483 RepID=A0A8X7BMY8_9ARAC|nr:hypothetical protein TNIN_443421 [Trichonephila inaurata madagascariensis]
MSHQPQVDTLRGLQWNAGGLSQSKRKSFFRLCEKDIDVFTIMEANLTTENLKYHPFKGFFLYMLAKSRQVARGILISVKN